MGVVSTPPPPPPIPPPPPPPPPPASPDRLMLTRDPSRPFFCGMNGSTSAESFTSCAKDKMKSHYCHTVSNRSQLITTWFIWVRSTSKSRDLFQCQSHSLLVLYQPHCLLSLYLQESYYLFIAIPHLSNGIVSSRVEATIRVRMIMKTHLRSSINLLYALCSLLSKLPALTLKTL